LFFWKIAHTRGWGGGGGKARARVRARLSGVAIFRVNLKWLHQTPLRFSRIPAGHLQPMTAMQVGTHERLTLSAQGHLYLNVTFIISSAYCTSPREPRHHRAEN
jgi:hypothetical protein